MRRFLFVVPPFVGHVYPTLGLAAEMQKRGYEVAWSSFPLMQSHLPAGARFYPCEVPLPDEVVESARERVIKGGMIGLQSHWQRVALPMAHAMLPTVEAAIADFKPDALVIDTEALGGSLAARRSGLPWATSSPTSEMAGNGHHLVLPLVEAWISNELAQLQRTYGLEPVDKFEQSERLVLFYTTTAVLPPDVPLSPQFRFVGPIAGGRHRVGILPDELLEDRRRMLISLGTIGVYRGAPFFQRAFEALEHEDLQLIVSAPEGLIKSHPANVLLRSWVDHETLLPRVDAVLTHGGSTATESLSYGKPLVIAPIASDQPIMADNIVSSGAGVRLSFARGTVPQIREAVLEVLNNPIYRVAAERIAESFRQAGGAPRAVDLLEELLPQRP